MSDDKDYGPYIARVLANCEECGTCLLWQGYMHNGVAPTRKFEGMMQPIRRVMWQAMGRRLVPGMHVIAKCKESRCVAPECATQVKPRGATGMKFNAAKRAAQAKGRRRWSKLTAEKVAEIRADERTGVEIAAELGLNPQYVQRLRRGSHWAPLTSPFAGLMP